MIWGRADVEDGGTGLSLGDKIGVCRHWHASSLGRRDCNRIRVRTQQIALVLRSRDASERAANSPQKRSVRSPLGRDAPNSLTRMATAPGFGRPAPAGFGIGSVGGAVRSAKANPFSVLRLARTEPGSQLS